MKKIMKESEEGDRIRKIIREERDKEREIRIVIRSLDIEDYRHLRKVLKKRVFVLLKGVPCTVNVLDDEDLDIRHKDVW